MSNVGNKYKVGVLVIISFIILIIALLSLGVLKYFKKTYDFMTVVESSVQGLEKGAKVKFKGVTIGQVSSIKITPQENVIYIYMQFDPEAFANQTSDKENLENSDAMKTETSFRNNFDDAVKRGLRCQLQLAGITGSLFVDISYFDPKIHPAKEYELPEEHPPYVPAIPSVSITNILEEVQKSVLKFSKVDFQKISDQIDELLKTAENIIKDANIKETIKEVKRISNNMQELSQTLKSTLTKEKMDKLWDKFETSLKKIDDTLADIKRLVNNADAQLQKADIPATSKQARDFMYEGKLAAKKVTELEDDLKQSLTKLNEALRSLQEFTNYLEKNPSCLIRGKAEKPVVKP